MLKTGVLLFAVALAAQIPLPTPRSQQAVVQGDAEQGNKTSAPPDEPVHHLTKVVAAAKTAGEYARIDNGKTLNGEPKRDWFDYISLGSTPIIGLLTLWVFFRQTAILKSTERTAQKTSIIARRQMLISGAQTDVMEKQKEIQRQEFLITHRPKLEVRFVRDVGGSVEITVINVGEGDAIFIAGRAIVKRVNDFGEMPTPHDIEGGEFDLRNRFRPSESDRVSISIGEHAFNAVFGGPLHIFGWIVYEPEQLAPVRRTTYFAFKESVGQPFFTALATSDWNFVQ